MEQQSNPDLSPEEFLSMITAFVMRYNFRLHPSENITMVDYEEARINQALRSGQLVEGVSQPQVLKIFSDAWKQAIQGRHVVVKATGSYYEMISLPSFRERRCQTPPASAASAASAPAQTSHTLNASLVPGEVAYYIEEFDGNQWNREYCKIEEYADKMMELMTSSRPFRTGCFTPSEAPVEVKIEDDKKAQPDIDMMLIDLDKKLCHKDDDGNVPAGELFAIIVPSKHPGFIYLQDPHTKDFISSDWFHSLDNYNDAIAVAVLVFVKLNTVHQFPEIIGISNQGPAVTLEFDVSNPQLRFTDSMDVVRSLKCSDWPPQARRWDDKKYHWPYPELVEQIIKDGCHIVAVPNPSCRDDKFEFRYSFSHAEVLLTKSFILTDDVSQHVHSQLFVYMVLKLLVKFYVKNSSDQMKSYYAKTCFFWYLESDNNKPGNWTCSRLWKNCANVLKILLKCFRERCMPNYCIPENNMIKHVDASDCSLIVEAIEKVLDDPIAALLQIHKDVIVLGYEGNEQNSANMTSVLEYLGFAPQPAPNFSILNTVFKSLTKLPNTKDGDPADLLHLQGMVDEDEYVALQRFQTFLRGSVGMALCSVQIQPKILSVMPMVFVHMAFQACSGICVTCRQDISVVDLWFWTLIQYIRQAPVVPAVLQERMTEFIKQVCYVGLGRDESMKFFSGIDLRGGLSMKAQQAQYWRWCAVILAEIQIKEKTRMESQDRGDVEVLDLEEKLDEVSVHRHNQHDEQTSRTTSEVQAAKSSESCSISTAESCSPDTKVKDAPEGNSPGGGEEILFTEFKIKNVRKDDFFFRCLREGLPGDLEASTTDDRMSAGSWGHWVIKLMFEKALLLAPKGNQRNVICLEYAAYLMHMGHIADAEQMCLDSEDLHDDDAIRRHNSPRPCLADLFQSSSCKTLKVHGISRKSILHDIKKIN